MIIKLYDTSLKENQHKRITEILQSDGVCVFPSETLYCFVCSIKSHKAARRLADLKSKQLEKSNFSFMCSSLSMASNYIAPLSDVHFRMLKNLDMELFTFVFKSSGEFPKIFRNKKKTVGIRITRIPALVRIIEDLGHPLLVSSVPEDEEDKNCSSDPELIHEKYEYTVDSVLDAGISKGVASTVLDMTDGYTYDIIRKGAGVV